MIGSKINNRNIKLNLYYEDVFHTVGCVDLYEKTLPFDDDASYEMDWSCPGYQIKTFNVDVDERRELDPDKMRRLDALWRKDTHDLDALYEQLMQNWYDKYLTVIPYTKKEWFASGNKEVGKSRMPYQMNREEAFAMLPGHQRKCGYQAGKYKSKS